MAIALALVLIAVGSVLFHMWSPWWWTPLASNWGYIDGTLLITFWITGLAFTAILSFMTYCLIRFRHRPGRQATFNPENKALEWWLSVATALGISAMLAPGLYVWQQFVTVPDGASEIEVVGQQWQWAYRFPGQDGRLGKAEVTYVTPENPLGVDPNDPNAQDDIIVEGGDLHLPVGKPVKILLRSLDVVHAFDVPAFRAQMDGVPGEVNYFWFTPTQTGTFDVICNELCGIGHPHMHGTVVVEAESDFKTWLQSQKTFAQTLAPTKKAESE